MTNENSNNSISQPLLEGEAAPSERPDGQEGWFSWAGRKAYGFFVGGNYDHLVSPAAPSHRALENNLETGSEEAAAGAGGGEATETQPGVSEAQKETMNRFLGEASKLNDDMTRLIIEVNKANNKGSHAFANQFLPNILLGITSGYAPPAIDKLNQTFIQLTDNFANEVLPPLNAFIGYALVGNVQNKLCAPTAGGELPENFNARATAREVAIALGEVATQLNDQRAELKNHMQEGREQGTRFRVELALWSTIGLIQHYAPSATAAGITPLGPVGLPLTVAALTIGISKAINSCRSEADIDRIIDHFEEQTNDLMANYGLQLQEGAAAPTLPADGDDVEAGRGGSSETTALTAAVGMWRNLDEAPQGASDRVPAFSHEEVGRLAMETGTGFDGPSV